MSAPLVDPLDFVPPLSGLQRPPEYWAAVRRLRSLALLVDFYVRPLTKVTHHEGRHGSCLVRPPHLRLIAESDDMGAHLRAAAAVPCGIQPEFNERAADDLMAAVRHCVSLSSSPDGLASWRRHQAAALQQIEESLRPYASFVSSHMEGSAWELASHMNLPFMAACVSAIGWPDVCCVRRWFLGHAVVGDIPDTGLFRPKLTDFAASPAEVFTAASNISSNSDLARSLASGGARSAADPELRAQLEGVESATAKELGAGVVRGPFSARQLNARFGRGQWRAQRRFGVHQGYEADGSAKIRAIDNSASNSCNAATRTHETIAPPSFAFVALCARLFLRFCRVFGCCMLSLCLGLDDMARAYRRVPVATPWLTVFAMWSLRRGRVEYYYLDGHCFGFVSAVLNFNAFPHLVCALSRVFLAVPCDHFYDDYMLVDLALAGVSGQTCLALVHTLLGQSVEPKKRQLMALRNVALGVQMDLSLAHTALVVHATATADRISRLLDSLAGFRAADFLTPAAASSLRGKLGFVFGTSYFRFCQASLQPLMQREYYESDTSFSRPLCDMHDFLSCVLPDLPPMALRLEPDATPPLVVYTDAMFLEHGPGGGPFVRIGWSVFDPVTRRSFHSHYELPPWYYLFFAPGKQTYIMQGEGVGALAPLLSLPSLFRGRSVIQFQDNTAALSALVHGYASKPDMSRIVNAYHLAQFLLGVRVWFEWVPSAANLADLPSRLEHEAFFRCVPDSIGVPTILPSLDEWSAPLLAMYAGMRRYLSV